MRTANVARIKTWQGGKGDCSDITYTNLTLIDVSNAIIIDQFYCPASQKQQVHTQSAVACDVWSILTAQLAVTVPMGKLTARITAAV